jgi:peptide chain release factor
MDKNVQLDSILNPGLSKPELQQAKQRESERRRRKKRREKEKLEFSAEM